MSPCFLNFIINRKKKMSLRIFSCVYKPFWILWWKHWFLKIFFAFYFPPLLLPFFWVNNEKFIKKSQRGTCSSESTRDQSGIEVMDWGPSLSKGCPMGQIMGQTIVRSRKRKKKKKDQAGKSQIGVYHENLYR